MSKTLNLPSVESGLFQLNDIDHTNDFVAISCEIDDKGFCRHSGLIISYEEELYYFHFSGKDVILENITEDLDSVNSLYIKKLEVVKEQEVLTFLGHCEKLKKHGIKPQYGFVFNDSYYDSNTEESYLVNCSHDITTCVGFCIKVIRGFIHNNEEYLKITDWNIDSLENAPVALVNYMMTYLEKYAKDEGIEVKDLFKQDELKRILPSELLSSGFFKNLPIPKSNTDSILPKIEQFFLKLKAA